MKKRIMVVDDEPSVILAVKSGLEECSSEFEVIGATSGKECLDLLKNKFLPDLILLDIMMPIMDGWEVQRKIDENATWRNIPIVFLTAVTDDISKKFGGIVGEDYVEKPFDIQNLKDRINTIVSGQK